MVIRLVADVAIVVQLPDAFVVSCNRCDFAMGHQVSPGDRKRTDKVVTLPLDKQRSKQADVGSHKAVIATHPFEQLTVIGQFLYWCFRIHFKPPSSSLLMSSCL